MDTKERLVQAMEDLDETALLDCVEKLRTEGTDFHQIEELLHRGIRGVGRRFEAGEYFLADLIVGGSLYKDVIESMYNNQKVSEENCVLGRVLLGVMEGDIHDIGKDIVCQMLRIEGFEVIDLGVDVNPKRFLEAAEKYHPDIVALSGVMGFSVSKMQEVIELFEKNGLRNDVKIVVGGNCMDYQTSVMMGADGYTEDSFENVALCKKIMENKKNHDE